MATSLYILGADSQKLASEMAELYNSVHAGGAQGCWAELKFTTSTASAAALKSMRRAGITVQTRSEFNNERQEDHWQFLVRSMGLDGARAYVQRHKLNVYLKFDKT